jgi:DNA replication protein DnaC
MSEELAASLRDLGLRGMLSGYEEVGQRARGQGFSYERCLEELAEREREDRHHRRVEWLLRQSRLPAEKTLESFDRSRLSAKLNAQLNRLLEGEFVQRCMNVLAFGNPGSGKSHLLCWSGRDIRCCSDPVHYWCKICCARSGIWSWPEG